MKGHIRKRGNRWSIVVDAGVHPETGRRRQRWYSARTRRLAERKLVEVLGELNQGVPPLSPRRRLGDYLRQWLSDYVEDGVRARTGDGYRTILNNRGPSQREPVSDPTTQEVGCSLSGRST